VAVFPYGWVAIRFVADNPGVWALPLPIESHFYMGMGVIFAEGIHKLPSLPTKTLGCGLSKPRH
jgi:L-ascorbate oxidase